MHVVGIPTFSKACLQFRENRLRVMGGCERYNWKILIV